jgi:hypothetical protein
MAEANRYTGKNVTIVFDGVTISNDYSELSIERSIGLAEKTAGADDDASYNTTYRSSRWSLKLFNTGEADASIRTKLKVGTTALLTVYPKGNTTGRPVLSFTAIVENYKDMWKFNDNTATEVSGVSTGAWASDIDALVS